MAGVNYNIGKIVWSNYHLTINWNTANTAPNRAAAVNSMRARLPEACRTPLLWTWLKFRAGPHDYRDFPVAQRPLVMRIRMRPAFEAGGGQNASVHAQILVEVTHRTWVNIDSGRLRAALRLPAGANMHLRFVRGDPNTQDREYLLRYLNKEGVPVAPADPDNAGLQSALQATAAETYDHTRDVRAAMPHARMPAFATGNPLGPGGARAAPPPNTASVLDEVAHGGATHNV